MQASTAYRVHVVDDDAAVRESFEAVLLVAGYHVQTYATAEAFLATAVPGDGCLLVDLHMPGMSGLDLVQIVTTRNPPMPVMVLTTSADRYLRARALELGAHDFLTKPVREATLFGALRAARSATTGKPVRS